MTPQELQTKIDACHEFAQMMQLSKVEIEITDISVTDMAKICNHFNEDAIYTKNVLDRWFAQIEINEVTVNLWSETVTDICSF